MNRYIVTVNWFNIWDKFSPLTEPIGHWYCGKLPESTCRYSGVLSPLELVHLGLCGLHPSVINTEDNKEVPGSSKGTSR